ncbi:MAG: 1-deoxy-D-xylulose-5-phosphate synthase [Candidatus Omnitrophica bacterium]|nr:1-deoxy-D-xylulose-5-phosphate synthase [Candidatus Omnitrophota bacterium]
MSPLLESIKEPNQIHSFSDEELLQLAEEMREKIIDSVSQTGGHFSSNLGTVELTVALHKVFDSPNDKIIWDVGHQAYPHKLLTGRSEQFKSLRQTDGLCGFLTPYESAHDIFGAGHAGTACSAAVGVSIANHVQKKDNKVIAIVGDGGMTAGMAFEALNHAGHLKNDLIVILNDNRWSISKNVGAMSEYLNRIITGQFYNRTKTDLEKIMGGLPGGESFLKMMHSAEEHVKGMIVPGTLFEELGFRYFGPVDGHDLLQMVDTLESVKKLKGPILLHAVTVKGKGYAPAEADAMKWHGPTPFDKVEGKIHKKPGKKSYTEIFVETLIEEAGKDDKLCAVTAAMASGTGLSKFAEAYPERFFDVAIAEQHAVTMGAGMAKGGLKPVVAIYSTFLQRGFDQVLHDAAIQNLPVIFAVDRAGLVGADGATHQGMFDMSYLRLIPNVTVLVPSNEAELNGMLKTAFNHNGPIAVRFPRTGITDEFPNYLKTEPIPIGESVTVREGQGGVALLAIGTMVAPSLEAAEALSEKGIDATVVNMRSLKPLDREVLARLAENHHDIITVEEHTIAGGFGSAVQEAWDQDDLPPVRWKRLGIKDHFVEHGSRDDMLHRLGLDSEGIARTVEAFVTHSHGAASGVYRQ